MVRKEKYMFIILSKTDIENLHVRGPQCAVSSGMLANVLTVGSLKIKPVTHEF